MRIPDPDIRLNVLLAEDRHNAPEYWVRQLPQLLKPQGVAAYIARTGREVMQLAQKLEIHAAIIDLTSPVGGGGVAPTDGQASAVDRSPAGIWLLEWFRRLPNRPPVVVVRGRAYSQGQVEYLLRESLRLGVFSVVNPPVDLEQILAVFRRLIDRQYRGCWPSQSTKNPESA